MPTKYHRVNLTVPPDLYDRLQSFRERYSVSSDAGACLQLMTQRLNDLEKTPLYRILLS